MGENNGVNRRRLIQPFGKGKCRPKQEPFSVSPLRVLAQFSKSTSKSTSID
jgi:hypothetical protein